MTDPRRRFNSAERVALYLAADGRCVDCGTELEPGWHGDHALAHSRGGRTDVINGRALCPRCNLLKGVGPVSELRPWQAAALESLLGSQEDFLCVATPGAGKTRFALAACQALITMGEVSRLVVVAPTAHLRGQWAAAAAKAGVQLNHRFVNGDGALARDFDGLVVTYAAVASAPLLYRKLTADARTLVILDEVHHGADELAWGNALQSAFEPAVRRLLLSGTPFRSDGKPIPFVRYDDERKCVPSYSYDYGEALRDRGVVRQIAFQALDGDVRWRDAGSIVSTALADTDDTTLANALNAALNPEGDWIGSVLRRADQELTRQRLDVPDAGGLVVAPDQPRALRYAEILRRITGKAPAVAISDVPDASDRIAEFASDTSRWIVAVQMVAEGVDIPRLAVGVYASRIKTEMFFRQVVGRFVRMRSPEDETYATLFIPSIQPLLKFAEDIERTVKHALREEEERARQEVKEAEQGQLRLDLVEPLDSSEASHHATILSGDSFSDAELLRAQTLATAAGMPSSVSAAAVARMLRLAGAGRVVGTVHVEPVAVPLADTKASLRRLVQKKVGLAAREFDKPHGHIHAELNRACGDTAKTATAESLNRRVTLLDQWLAQA